MTNGIEIYEYDSQRDYLPSLIGTKIKDREELEMDPAVENLINSGLLLDKELNSLIYTILSRTQELKELMAITPRWHFHRVRRSAYIRHRLYMSIKRKRMGLPKTKKELERYLESELVKEVKKENQNLKKRIKDKSDKIQDLLKDFVEKRKVDLEILSHTTIGFCPNCYSIIFKDMFKGISCQCGKHISNSADTKQLPIYKFNEKMIRFIKQNRWLEHGIDNLFLKKNYQTLCGFYLLGSSGVLHELDNVAESKKEKRRIFAECKTSTVGTNDILILNGKMLDVGCSIGYIFTTTSEVDKTIKQLAKSRNITIIEAVLEKRDKDLLRLII